MTGLGGHLYTRAWVAPRCGRSARELPTQSILYWEQGAGGETWYVLQHMGVLPRGHRLCWVLTMSLSPWLPGGHSLHQHTGSEAYSCPLPF